MFQYAVGRLLAEELGYTLVCPAISGFPGTHDVVAGQQYERDPVTFGGHTIDLAGLRAGRYHGRQIVLEGWFMVYDYLRPALPKIRSWFRPGRSVAGPVGDNHLVVHWRVGDYVRRRRPWKVLPSWLVESAIDRRSWDKVYVVTNAPDHPPIQRLVRRRGATIVAGSTLADFEFIRQASNIMLSTSSFSWWAAMLSNADQVIYPEIYNWHPLTVFFPNAQIPAERLFPHDQPRFQKIPGPVLRTGMTLVRIPFYRYPHNVDHLSHFGAEFRRWLTGTPTITLDPTHAAGRLPDSE